MEDMKEDKQKLRRITGEPSWLGGVCSGVAYWLGIQVWAIRLLWICSIFLSGFGVFLYFILWMILPEWEKDPDDFEKVTGD